MSNSSIYIIDGNAIGQDNTPSRVRKSKFSAFVAVMLAPLYQLNQRFNNFRRLSDYKVTHDSRKISLEKLLNDAFDSAERRIYISLVAPKQPVYLYETADDRPVYVYEPLDNTPVFLYDTVSGDLNTANFLVVLPLAIQPENQLDRKILETKINAQVDYYKLFSKNHALVWTE